VTNRVRAAYPHAQTTAVGHSLGGTLAQDIKGSDKQITFNKADVLYKRRPKSQIDYRKTADVTSVLSHLKPGANKVKRSGNRFPHTNCNLKRLFYAIIYTRT
jgi:putative lipase involved disintegration of autophagic bodies